VPGFNLTVFITGLCGFVAHSLITPCTVLQNEFDCREANSSDYQCTANNRVQVNFLNGERMNPPHKAVVLIRKEFVGAGSTRQKTKKLTNADGDVYYRYDLADKERAELSPTDPTCRDVTTTGCVEIVYGLVSPDAEVCPKRENRCDIHWVGAMKRIAPNADGQMAEEAHRRPHEVPSLVKAHLMLHEGRLSVAHFARNDKTDEIIRWEVDRLGRDFEQSLADVVKFVKTIPDNNARIVFLEHDANGNWIEKNHVEVKPHESTQPVIEFLNIRRKDLCKNAGGSGPSLDFDMLYRMLHKELDLGPPFEDGSCGRLPLTPMRLCRPPGARINDPQCPTAWFERSP